MAGFTGWCLLGSLVSVVGLCGCGVCVVFWWVWFTVFVSGCWLFGVVLVSMVCAGFDVAFAGCRVYVCQIV